MSTSINNSVESFVPVKAIINNMIELDSGEKIAGVKVIPKNIFILDQSDQYAVVDRMKDMYNSFDFEFWTVMTDRKVDISFYIAQLQVEYNKATSPVIRKLLNQDLSKANEFTDTVSDVEFYIFFKEKDINIIQKRIRLIMSGLSNAGLASSQATNEDLRSVLDSFLNDGKNFEFGTVGV